MRTKGTNTTVINHFDNTGIAGRSPDQVSKPIASIALELFKAWFGANHLSMLVSLPQ